MKTILNKTQTPLAIHLPGGKILHLNPGKTGNISDKESSAPKVLDLVAQGSVEIFDEGAHLPSGAAAAGKRHSSGTHRPRVSHTRGDR